MLYHKLPHPIQRERRNQDGSSIRSLTGCIKISLIIPSNLVLRNRRGRHEIGEENEQALLSFEISGLMHAGRKVCVAQDVKIEVMKPADIEKLSESMSPEPDVSFWVTDHGESDELTFPPQLQILLPPLQKLGTIVERLRPMSNILAV